MNNSEKEAIETALLWNEEGFNKRDRKISVDLMHFPHVRLWNNQFSIFNSEEESLLVSLRETEPTVSFPCISVTS